MASQLALPHGGLPSAAAAGRWRRRRDEPTGAAGSEQHGMGRCFSTSSKKNDRCMCACVQACMCASRVRTCKLTHTEFAEFNTCKDLHDPHDGNVRRELHAATHEMWTELERERDRLHHNRNQHLDIANPSRAVIGVSNRERAPRPPSPILAPRQIPCHLHTVKRLRSTSERLRGTERADLASTAKVFSNH